MKKLLLFALLCVPAFGQVHSDIATQNTVGNWVKVVPGALVYVCDPNTADASCLIGTGVTTLYTTSGLTTPTTQPITADSNGNYTFYATPGIYKQCVKGTTSFCQQIQVAGIGTQNGIPFNCPAAVNGSVVGMTSTITSSCDPNGITDFVGHWTSQSYRATGAFNGTVELTGALADPTNPPDTDSVAFLAPTAVPTPYYLRPPASIGTVGQCLQLLSQASGTNGVINALQWATCGTGSGSVTSFSAGNLSPLFTTSVATSTSTPALTFSLTNAAANTVFGNFTGSSGAPSYNAVAACGDSTHALAWTSGTGFSCQAISAGSAATFQVNSVNTTSQTTLNFTDTSTVLFTNPSAGVIQATTTFPQASNPSAPTLAVGGTPGAATVCYKVVGNQSANGSYHSAASSQTCATTANATLASSPITLTAYGDTLYGYRCFDIYRNSGGPSQGKVGTCVGKKFIDTSVAGDGSTAPSTNNTVLDPNGLTAPLPGCNKIPAAPWGVDGPPCSPNAADDEMGAQGGAPADSNNSVWAWQNQGSCTAVWTGGMINLSCPATGSNALRCLLQTAPATPYTFQALNYHNYLASSVGSESGIAFFESATGKFTTLFRASDQGELLIRHWTTATAAGNVLVGSIASSPTNGYNLKIQADGTNLVYSTSPDGVTYTQQLSEAKAAFFTTAPDKIGLCVNSNALVNSDYDYWRRTQ